MRKILISCSAALILAACGDPLQDVQRLSDVSARDGAAAVADRTGPPSAQEGGLFSRLLNRTPDDPANAAVEAALAEAQGEATEDAVATEAASTPRPERTGLFGLFGGGANAAEPAVATSEDGEADATQAAATVAPEQERRGFGGIFRRNDGDATPPRNGPDGRDVEAGTMMPFGEIARVCGASRRDLGREVAQEAGYRIYDTIPNSTAPRPFYITGFSDNCARTFSGAVVVPGDHRTHEFVRYQPSNEKIGYTTVDNAYEALKASECRVGRGQPCGSRGTRLTRNTQFLSVYNLFGNSFGSVPRTWVQILVHDGRVLAISTKNG